MKRSPFTASKFLCLLVTIVIGNDVAVVHDVADVSDVAAVGTLLLLAGSFIIF